MIEIEVIRTVQQKLSQFMFSKGYLSWNGIRRACESIILALPEDQKKLFDKKNYPEFEIVIPLLRNGTVEVCRSNDRATLLYCMSPNINVLSKDGKEYIRTQEYFSIYRIKEDLGENKEDVTFTYSFDPISFLRSYPSIEQQITSFVEQEIQSNSLRFEQNLNNYQYKMIDNDTLHIGIYKLDDKVWTYPYLYDKKKCIRKIPYYAEDPDSMNLARLYVRLYNEAFSLPLFKYNKSSKELRCIRYSEIPILLTRALLLFEPKQLTSEEFCTNHPSVPFKNVPDEAVKELQRIFSYKTIEIKRD